MTATPTPLSAGTDVGETIGGKLHGRTMVFDTAGADGLGLVTTTPAPTTLLGRLKAIADLLAGNLTVTGTFFQATQPVSVAALPLPSGAATSAAQGTGNASLTSIDGKLTGVATAAKQDALLAATAITLAPFAITPDPTAALPRPITAIAIVTGGSIIYRHPAEGSDRTVTLPAGFFPFPAAYIRTGGTASGLTGF